VERILKDIRLGTRRSKLALAQANIVKDLIESRFRNISVTLVPIKTLGDDLSRSNDLVQNKSIFTSELENALLSGKIDIAVHSMKDLPSALDSTFTVAGTPERADARDALVTLKGYKLKELPSGARIGTSSLRRKYQIKELRSDINIVDIHGNVDTRVRKVKENQLDGIIVAACGLQRLGMEDLISEFFEVDQIIPAACQGILALEVLSKNAYATEIAKEINHVNTYNAASCERIFLEEVGGDCNDVVAAYATVKGERVSFLALLGLPEKMHIERYRSESPDDIHVVAKKAATTLLQKVHTVKSR
jgi:hydroxymethylbilane synthase